MALRLKFGIPLLLAVIAVVSLWWFYGPEHLLVRITDFATVTVDEHPVHAETYIAHPTYYEADAILLVIVPAEGNYLFNFGEEKFREISSKEFVRLHWGVVHLRPVSRGNWLEPLSFRNLNEFRIISATGHAVTVKF
jgi:hypothetical protein